MVLFPESLSLLVLTCNLPHLADGLLAGIYRFTGLFFVCTPLFLFNLHPRINMAFRFSARRGCYENSSSTSPILKGGNMEFFWASRHQTVSELGFPNARFRFQI